MKISLMLAASACALLCTGCDGFLKFKGSGDGGTGGGSSSSFTHASSVNVYNCSGDKSVMVYRAPVGSSAWQLVDGTGSSTTDSADCPDESDWPINVPIPAGEDHVIRILFKGINDPNCNDQKPELTGCGPKNKTYTGDNGAGIVDWVAGS